jgi:hypothetical protein
MVPTDISFEYHGEFEQSYEGFLKFVESRKRSYLLNECGCKPKSKAKAFPKSALRIEGRTNENIGFSQSRNYERELAEFEEEMFNMMGYGDNDFSTQDRLKHERSVEDQRWEEAERERAIVSAVKRWREEMNDNKYRVRREDWPYYWCQYLPWRSCLCDLSPPPGLVQM